MTVSIVTPWTDHLELVDDYMLAVERADEVVVVDNASDPPLPFASVRLSENLGFCGGSNVGLAIATGEIVVFLNNDVAALDSRWLERLCAAVEPGVLAGARLRSDAHAIVDGRLMPYLDGWCLAGIRDELLELGGFDETLEEPAYYSDNLLCLEAQATGMCLREAPVGLLHKCGVTSQPLLNRQVQTASRANRARYLARARELLAVA